jgi:predicted HicB family RNase H-like nuclease
MSDKTIIVRVSSDLHKAFKVKCAQDATNMNKVLTDMIESYVKETKPKKK